MRPSRLDQQRAGPAFEGVDTEQMGVTPATGVQSSATSTPFPPVMSMSRERVLLSESITWSARAAWRGHPCRVAGGAADDDERGAGLFCRRRPVRALLAGLDQDGGVVATPGRAAPTGCRSTGVTMPSTRPRRPTAPGQYRFHGRNMYWGTRHRWNGFSEEV